MHQLVAGVRGHVRVQRAKPVAGPGRLFPHVQRVLSDGSGVRRGDRAGDEKQDVGRDPTATGRPTRRSDAAVAAAVVGATSRDDGSVDSAASCGRPSISFPYLPTYLPTTPPPP